MSEPHPDRKPLVCVRPPGWISGADDNAFERMANWARHAEALGFDGIFLGDRLMAQADTDGQTVYAASMLEVTTTLAALAAATEHLLVGPLVLVLPYRHPVQLAKVLSTLDIISGGRLVLGAGLGWNRREFDTLGIDKAERGPRAEAALDVMRRLWRGERVSLDQWWRFDDVSLSPRPQSGRNIPVWLASFSPDSALDWAEEPPPSARRTLDRIGRLADGWVPLIYSASNRRRLNPSVLGRAWQRILTTANNNGRTRDELSFVLSDWCQVVETPADERHCRQALEGFFTGDWDEARQTYTIGSPDDVVHGLSTQTACVDHVDAYILTPLSDDLKQLDALAKHVAPTLRATS